MDMRAKVAYEKAARLVDAEAARHEFTGQEAIGPICDYCEDPWILIGGIEGCPARRDLIRLSEQIRTLKRNA